MEKNKEITSDYRKCVLIIDSCINSGQLLNCDNLIKGFESKHRKDKTSWKRYKELNNLINQNISKIHQQKLLKTE